MNFNLTEAELDSLAERVAARLQPQSTYIDQFKSPLGSRRHIQFCRANPSKCKQVGRRYLAPTALITEHMRMDDTSDLAAELGL